MSDQFGQNGAGPEFSPPELHGPALPTPYNPRASAEPPLDEPVRPRLTLKTGLAAVAGLVAILLVSGAVTVWASSATPRAAMPAAWTAEPSATTGPQHATAPVATGNRATSSATPSAPGTSSSAATKTFPSGAQAPTVKVTVPSSSLPSCGSGQTVSTAVFSLKVPEGWCFEQAVSGTVIQLYDTGMDFVTVTVSGAKDVTSACGPSYLTFQSDAIVTAQPDTVWGGKAAKAAKVTVPGLAVQVRCAESKGVIYLMAGLSPEGAVDIVAAMNTVGSAWVWK